MESQRFSRINRAKNKGKRYKIDQKAARNFTTKTTYRFFDS
jgi:hypothetical protein